MGTINLSLILKVFTGLAYLLAIVTCVVALVKVDETQSVKVRTCKDFYGNKDTCVDNINANFAVAMLAAGTILLSVLGLVAYFWDSFRAHFVFLNSFLGSSLYLCFIGLCVLGLAGDLGISSAIVCFIIGVFSIVFFFLVARHE